MSQVLLKLYHRMPTHMRSVAATMRGAYLRSWRYGPTTDSLVAAAIEREHWSPETWKAWREERLARVLHRAASKVPYYREQWKARRRRGDLASWEYLENWPVLEKEALRTVPRSFVADDCDIKHMYHEHTSGTTGKSLDLWWSRKMVREWYALFEARWRQWYGVSRHDRWTILGGQLVTPVSQIVPPFWVWNAALNQLYMSSYHLSPSLIPHYLDALIRYRIRYIWAYSSSVFALAQEALQLCDSRVKLEVVVTNAEPLFEYQRETISKAFACPVRETYGMSEAVAAAGECEAGALHYWPEVGWIETLEDGVPTQPGGLGDLICTGLLNSDMPLIRYRVGDRGALVDCDVTCSCGRTLPQMAKVEGRIDDVLYTLDGRRIGRLDPIFKANLPVREAQIVQETLSRIVVRYVPAQGFTAESAMSITERLQERMGQVEVLLQEVSEVPRTANGKFRAVICNVPRSELP